MTRVEYREEAGEEVAGASGVLLGRDREQSQFTRSSTGSTRAEARSVVAPTRGSQIGPARGHTGASATPGHHGGLTTGTLSEAQLALQGSTSCCFPCSAAGSPSRPPAARTRDGRSGLADAPAPDLFLIASRRWIGRRPGGGDAAPLYAVEDGHWLDRPPPRCSSSWPGGFESDPVLLLFAVREGVVELFDDADLPELHVAGLDQWASTHSFRPRRATLRQMFSAGSSTGGGQPPCLIELPVALRPSSAHKRRGPTAPADRPTRAASRRDSRTSLPACKKLPPIAALDEVDLAELSHAAGRPVEPDDLTPAVAAGLGTLDRRRFRFRHPLIRSACSRPQARRSFETRMQPLAEGSQRAGRAVWHRAAPHPGRARTLPWPRRGAERARRRGGGGVAVAAHERAAELTADPHNARVAALPRGRPGVRSRPSERGRAAATGGAAARPTCCRARDRLVLPGAG